MLRNVNLKKNCTSNISKFFYRFFYPSYLLQKFCMVGILVIMLSTPLGAESSQENEFFNKQFTILILHSYHKDFSWTESIDTGIRQSLHKVLPNLIIKTEYMDTKNYFNPFYIEKLFDIYMYKYARKKVDLVISCDDNAFNFLRQKGRQIFGGIPFVFCGVNYFQDNMLDGLTNITGVVESFDLKSTLDLAFSLNPEKKKVAVVVDQTPTGTAVIKQFNKIISNYNQRYDFIMLGNETMDHLLEQIEGLPPNSLILLLNYNRDLKGQVFDHVKAVELIYQAANVPIFGLWDFHLGHGIVGGMITSGNNQGRASANLAFRILKGESANTIKVIKQSPNQWMFDYNQLVRFNLQQKVLPKNSVVINRPVSFYEINKYLIWGLSGGIFFLILIILILTENIIVRKRVQNELRDTTDKLTALLDELPVVPFSTTLKSDMEFLYVSGAIFKITGFQPKDFINNRDFWKHHIHPDDYLSVCAKLSQENPNKIRLTYRFLSADGQYLWFSDIRQIVESTRMVGFWQDITVEKKLRQKADLQLQQIIQADKLASLGELVAGVAHEIRNPNAFISTNLPLLKETWELLRPCILHFATDHDFNMDINELCDDMENMISDIKTGSQRIDRIVNELNEFTRSSNQTTLQPVQINDVVRKAQILVGAQIRKIFSKFDLILDPELPLINGHPTKLEQIVANLIVNATHAVKPGIEPELKIFTRQLHHPPSVLIQVQDNGHGIASELRERIFEPFFTTRREAGGTGLGLSVCYRLVQEHQGAIFLVSRQGSGSRFTVALPCQPGQPVIIQPTLLWVDLDIERLKELDEIACTIKTIEFISLNKPSDLLKKMDDLPQVLTVCLATSPLNEELSDLSDLLRSLSVDKPLVTRAVYCGKSHRHDIESDIGHLADAIVSGPLTPELLQQIIHINLRKIL